MRSMHGAKPDVVLEQLLSAVNVFARGAPQADDITVLIFRYRGRHAYRAVSQRSVFLPGADFGRTADRHRGVCNRAN